MVLVEADMADKMATASSEDEIVAFLEAIIKHIRYYKHIRYHKHIRYYKHIRYHENIRYYKHIRYYTQIRYSEHVSRKNILVTITYTDEIFAFLEAF